MRNEIFCLYNPIMEVEEYVPVRIGSWQEITEGKDLTHYSVEAHCPKLFDASKFNPDENGLYFIDPFDSRIIVQVLEEWLDE